MHPIHTFCSISSLQHVYVKEDCAFLEHILPNGYNIYMSDKHRTLLSLGGGKKRPQSAFSQFLPMVNTLSQEPKDYNSREGHSPVDPDWDLHLGLQTDMESFGKISQIVIQSPSFNKRWVEDSLKEFQRIWLGSAIQWQEAEWHRPGLKGENRGTLSLRTHRLWRDEDQVSKSQFSQ